MMYLASLEEAMKDKVEGYKIIKTKRALDEVIVDNLNSNKVMIRQDFAHEYFTPTGLTSYIENARRLNLNITIELDSENEVIVKKVLVDKIRDCATIEELIQLMVIYDTEFMDVMRSLIESKDMNYNTMLEYSNQVSRLQSIVEDQSVSIAAKDLAIEQEATNKLSYQSKFHVLISRINYQYNKTIDESNLFKVDKNSYDKILYIKEITRVQYTDTLIYYLKEILKVLYSMPTRLITIEGYYADGKIDNYPNLKCHHTLIEKDVLDGDILMLGMQPNLMKDILRNASKVSILIVLDRGGKAEPHISGDNVEVLYTVSDLKDKPDWIPNGRCISYDESTLFVNYIPEFDTMDASAKISAYSSMEIVKSIIGLVERK